MNPVNLGTFGVMFAMDLVAIALVAYGLYFRRHARRDLLATFTVFNVGLFLVLTVLSVRQAGIGVGFGLFAILSIIRIRSDEFSNTELAYCFLAMVLAVVNALGVGRNPVAVADLTFTLMLNLAAILVVAVMDSRSLSRGTGRRQITLDTIHSEDASLRADLEHRLGAEVLDYSISHVDYVRDLMLLDVRYRERRGEALASTREG